MNSNWERAFQEQLKNEGGYVNHPADPGGPTNMGITLAVLAKWRHTPVTAKDVQNLKVDEAKAIYKAWYWDVVGGDLLPSGLDYSVFDYGSASGPQKAVMELQKLVGVADDGKVGNVTLAAIANAGDLGDLIDRYQNDRLAFYKRLSTWPVFGRGWESRIERVRGISKELAQLPVSAPDTHTPKTEVQPPAAPFDFWTIVRIILNLLKAFL